MSGVPQSGGAEALAKCTAVGTVVWTTVDELGEASGGGPSDEGEEGEGLPESKNLFIVRGEMRRGLAGIDGDIATGSEKSAPRRGNVEGCAASTREFPISSVELLDSPMEGELSESAGSVGEGGCIVRGDDRCGFCLGHGENSWRGKKRQGGDYQVYPWEGFLKSAEPLRLSKK